MLQRYCTKVCVAYVCLLAIIGLAVCLLVTLDGKGAAQRLVLSVAVIILVGVIGFVLGARSRVRNEIAVRVNRYQGQGGSLYSMSPDKGVWSSKLTPEETVLIDEVGDAETLSRQQLERARKLNLHNEFLAAYFMLCK